MVITDLGEIGENAIVVFEEAVGVGAEEIVCGQVAVTNNILHLKLNRLYYASILYFFVQDQEFVTFSDQENEILLENPANVSVDHGGFPYSIHNPLF